MTRVQTLTHDRQLYILLLVRGRLASLQSSDRRCGDKIRPLGVASARARHIAAQHRRCGDKIRPLRVASARARRIAAQHRGDLLRRCIFLATCLIFLLVTMKSWHRLAGKMKSTPTSHKFWTVGCEQKFKYIADHKLRLAQRSTCQWPRGAHVTMKTACQGLPMRFRFN